MPKDKTNKKSQEIKQKRKWSFNILHTFLI